MLKSSALLLRCWWRKKDLIAGLFFITCYSLGEVPRFTISNGSHRCICQPTHGTSQYSPDAPLHFHRPLLPFQPHVTQGAKMHLPRLIFGSLTNPPLPALFLRSAARRIARSTAFLRSCSKALRKITTSPEREDCRLGAVLEQIRVMSWTESSAPVMFVLQLELP